jgi:hypothetical protein
MRSQRSGLLIGLGLLVILVGFAASQKAIGKAVEELGDEWERDPQPPPPPPEPE